MTAEALNPEQPPEFSTQIWFNTGAPLTLASLKGRVIFLTAFQTHCPLSLRHALPQAARMAKSFVADEVAVIGLNTAFEEHDKQAAGALEAFVRANGYTFPIAKDKPDGAHVPRTMAAYHIQATPTVLIFDRQGRLRRHYLGEVDDIRLAAEVMALVIEPRDAPREQSITIERRLAAALVDPGAHEHDGDCCGGHHDHGHHHDDHHGHEHSHAHEHEHDGDCCGGSNAHAPTPEAQPTPARAKLKPDARAEKAPRARR